MPTMNNGDLYQYINAFTDTYDNDKAKIDFPEMIKFLRKMGWPEDKYPEKDITAWLKESDGDINMDSISRENITGMLGKRPENEQEVAMIRQRFGRHDGDGDGTMTKTELAEYYKKRGMTPDDDFVNKRFDSLDKNKDGTVSIEEFIESYL